MRHLHTMFTMTCVGCMVAAFVTSAGAVQPLRPAIDPFIAGDSPCTEYEWVGKALVKSFDGDLQEIIGRGTVCAGSRDEARKLAHQAMHNYASQFGQVLECGADLA